MTSALRPFHILARLVYLPDYLLILHRKYGRHSDVPSRQHRHRHIPSRQNRQRHVQRRRRQDRHQRSNIRKQRRQRRRTSSKIARMTASHGRWLEEISTLRRGKHFPLVKQNFRGICLRRELASDTRRRLPCSSRRRSFPRSCISEGGRLACGL